MRISILKSAGYIFAATVVSKIIGFIKSMIQAAYYGATDLTDTYYMADGIVENLVYLFVTALGVAFVPIYIKTKNDKGSIFVKTFASNTIITMILFSFLVVVILEISAPMIIKMIAPFYLEEQTSLTVSFFRVMNIGTVFALISALYLNILNAEKIYGYSAFTSIINSVVLVILILLFSERIGVWSLVVSVPISYIAQSIFLYLRGKKYADIKGEVEYSNPRFKYMIVQTVPILISQATVEINQVVDRALLSSMEAGIVTAVSYSAVLYQFVVHIISIPISTVMFTELSESVVKGDYDYIKDNLKDTYTIIVMICLPIIVSVCFTAVDIVNIVYGRGKFDFLAVSNTSQALIGYIFCLIPVTIKSILTKAYYSFGDTKRPMRFGMLEVALNIPLSIILSKYIGMLGVILATAISSLVIFILMLVDFNNSHLKISFNIFQDYWKIILSIIIATLITFQINSIISNNSYLRFCLISLITFGVYWICLLILSDKIVVHLRSLCEQHINHL